MTILVTGANGGLGKNLVPWLREHYSERVIGCGRSDCLDSDYSYCDVSDETAISALIADVKTNLIFHLAGSFSGDFKKDVQVNALSAMFIFESIIANKLETRVVVLGSAAEYGVVQANDNPVSEEFRCKPVSVYGMTKLIQTDISSFYHREKGIDVVVARVFNLAMNGLSERLFYGRAESQIAAYRRGEVNEFKFGNLDSKRDYIALDEFVLQLKCVSDFGVSGEIYNLGSGQAETMRHILTEMIKNGGLRDVVVKESVFLHNNARAHDVPIIFADISKLKRLSIQQK